jgi:LuxR family maltose regulon positive regulatory protein
MSERANIDASPSRRHIIKRPRLTRLLDDTKARCILLVAPAGYGKTTLAAEWLSGGRRSVWYRTDGSAEDVIALSASLASAVGTIIPGAGDRLLEHIHVSARHALDVAILVDMLVEDVSTWPDDAWLVVDDYQRLSGADDSEAFIDELARRSPIQMLVTSRVRPSWATARRILYGELCEVPRSALAMNRDEVIELIPEVEGEAPGLVALADGWPAVIGLAAHSQALARIDPAPLPSMLYDYFAEELLRAAAPDLQWDLCRIAIAPRTTPQFLRTFLAAGRAIEVTVEGDRLGFLQPDHADGMRIHPLLRSFLLAKLNERPADEVRSAVVAVGRIFLGMRRWDDSFEIASTFESDELLIELIEASVDHLLASGRLASLSAWIAYADGRPVRAPVLELAKANLALRKGAVKEAITLGLAASADPALAGRGLVVAGRAAHLSFADTYALELHRRAEQAASTPDDVREAIWGQFVCASDLELEEATAILRRLEKAVEATPDGQIQLATGHLSLGVHRGGIDDSIAHARAAESMLAQATDPLARTSFMNNFADALVVAARYKEALAVVDRELDELEKFRLRFASPYATLVRAAALCGCGNTDAAADLCATTLEEYEASDAYIRLSARMILARALLLQGVHDAVVDLVPESTDIGVTHALSGHYCATRGLALLAAGDGKEAREQAHRAKTLTKGLEAHTLAAWTIVATQVRATDPEVGHGVVQAARLTFRGGDRNSLVTAYRVAPELLRCIFDSADLETPMVRLLNQVGDVDFARRQGIRVPDASPTRQSGFLSDRETEVADLLLQGMSNREIGRALFISEVTVKVHLRHIFAKLNARSRTQAALKLRDRAESSETHPSKTPRRLPAEG